MGRYRLICVAPEVPDAGSYDDLDEAIANSTANFEVYDTKSPEGASPWVGAYCKEDYQEAVARYRAKAAIELPNHTEADLDDAGLTGWKRDDD